SQRVEHRLEGGIVGQATMPFEVVRPVIGSLPEQRGAVERPGRDVGTLGPKRVTARLQVHQQLKTATIGGEAGHAVAPQQIVETGGAEILKQDLARVIVDAVDLGDGYVEETVELGDAQEASEVGIIGWRDEQDKAPRTLSGCDPVILTTRSGEARQRQVAGD